MSVFITFKGSPKVSTPTLDKLLFGGSLDSVVYNNGRGTVTYQIAEYGSRLESKHHADPYQIGIFLHQFVYSDAVQELLKSDIHTHYRTFKIPKRSGGLRTINAPDEALSKQLTTLKDMIESNVFYHTNAFAYVRGRSTVDAIKKHQRNESNWFGKFDLHDFFGSTTLDFVMSMLSKIYPFNKVMKNPVFSEDLRTALSLGFLDGGLPQGTPLSPALTNLIMVPFDFEFTRFCTSNSLVYTRYADDILVSSRAGFDVKFISARIRNIFRRYEAPYVLNEKKTRYGSRQGSNWNLGVMLNKDNNITVGHKNKKRFQSMLHNYARDKKSGIDWSISDVQELSGLISYYKMIEGDTIERIIRHHSEKMNLDIVSEIKADLRR